MNQYTNFEERRLKMKIDSVLLFVINLIFFVLNLFIYLKTKKQINLLVTFLLTLAIIMQIATFYILP